MLDTLAKKLHLDLSIDTNLALLWLVTAAIVSILATLAIAAHVRRRIAKNASAAIDASFAQDGSATTPVPPTVWQRLTLRSLWAIAPAINLALALLGAALLNDLGYKLGVFQTLQPLLISWLAVGLVYSVTHNPAKTIFIALLLMPASLPFIQPYLAQAGVFLNELSFKVGKSEITALLILRLIITGILFLWIASAIKDGVNASLSRMQHVNWATRQLLQNLSTIVIYALAIVIGLSLLGIDLTAFAVLGGALGVGIGLGLQKIASNFISGLILLSERSIQVNDMIEVAGSGITGLVRHTGARYTLIETMDAREVMIPNDDLVTNRVINWTYSDAHGIIRIDIGVSYESDIELARDLLIAAAKAHPSALKDPAPGCILRGFGASSVDFSLILHVGDVRDRRAGIQSEILFDIWHRFKQHNIDIPYPQMTVHYADKQPPATPADGTSAQTDKPA